MAILFRRSNGAIQPWCGMLTRVLFLPQQAGRDPNQTSQNGVCWLEFQRGQRKINMQIEEKRVIGGEMREMLLVRLEA